MDELVGGWGFDDIHGDRREERERKEGKKGKGRRGKEGEVHIGEVQYRSQYMVFFAKVFNIWTYIWDVCLDRG